MAPVDILWRLADVATGRKRNHEPAISAQTAAFVSITFTLLYVVPFYLSPRTRPSPTLNRDAPSVIQARIRSVSVAVTISIVATLYILTDKGHLDFESSLHHLGLWPVSITAIVRSFSLTLLLYTAPLYNDIFVERNLSPTSEVWPRVYTSLSSSMGYRNYIAGPITEELMFRSVVVPIHLLSPLIKSPAKLVFLTPLYFGVAHVHHFYEFRLSHPDALLQAALLRTIFQFGYTTIFGWYATFIYLRTGSVIAVIIIHAFCNYMGFPRLWGMIRLNQAGPYRSAQLGPVIKGKDDAELEPLSAGDRRIPKDENLKVTIIYYVLLFLGAFAFYWCFWSWTEMPKSQLVNFDSK